MRMQENHEDAFLLIILVAVSTAPDAHELGFEHRAHDLLTVRVPPHVSPLLGSTGDDVLRAIHVWLHLIIPADKLQPYDDFGAWTQSKQHSHLVDAELDAPSYSRNWHLKLQRARSLQ